ncbi:MAG: hypothetical protein CW338_11005 [Clostridiales bacterium]|nr:hypothetical protein [Clostridiales bacterium]
MGLFNPISGQFEALQRAMDDRKTIALKDAAAAMNVKPEKVDHSLFIMTKRGLFGDDRPYVDEAINMVVLDKRYADYALTQYALKKLKKQLSDARKAPGALRNAHQAQYLSGSGRAGKFIRNLAAGVLNGEGVGNSLLNATDRYIEEGKRKEDINLPDTQEMEETLTEMLSDAGEMADLMLMHPDDRYTKQTAEWLNSVLFDIQSWQGCLESAFTQKVKGAAMLRLEDRIKNEHKKELNEQKESLKGVRREKQDSHERDLSRDIYLCCIEMQKKKTQLRNETMRGAIDSIVELLADIHSHMMVGRNLTGRGSVQSLRSCYLPMVQSLTDQYIKYERLRALDENTLRAMRETEQVMENDVPAALRKMLGEIGAGNAIDMESQAEALKHKLQLDGLVDMNA